MRMKLAVLAPLSIALLSLTACGDADPGSAATAGDVSVSTDTASETTTLYCDALATVNQVTSRAGMRAYVATALATRELSAEFAASYGVDLDEAMADQTAAFVAGVPQISPEQAEAVAQVELTPQIAQTIAPLVGAAVDPTGSDADQTTAGMNAYDDYIAAHPVTLSPAYGGPRVAVAVSNTSLVAGKDVTQVTPEEVSALPESQRCGSSAAPTAS